MTDNTDSTLAVAGIGVFNKSIVPPEHNGYTGFDI
jgi:hypothetical protein